MEGNRLLAPSLIPASLWDTATETLTLPACLAAAYIQVVDKNSLRQLAGQRGSGEGPVGGLSKELSDMHFAQAFDGSAARTLLAVLDPKREVGAASDTFIRCTAGNSISLTDVPCGAGAAGLTFLATLAHLRAESVLPREPLEVNFTAGELSSHAREYAEDLLNRMRPSLEAQAIFVTSDFQSWDVTCAISTASLVRRCVVASHSVSSRLLVVANFNGFLERERKRADAEPQLNELFRYASESESFAIWIEPIMNSATAPGGFFPWLRNKIEAGWRKFARLLGSVPSSGVVYTSEARFRLPLQPTDTARVGLAVMSLELGPE